jgi:hypothetical protein
MRSLNPSNLFKANTGILQDPENPLCLPRAEKLVFPGLYELDCEVCTVHPVRNNLSWACLGPDPSIRAKSGFDEVLIVGIFLHQVP